MTGLGIVRRFRDASGLFPWHWTPEAPRGVGHGRAAYGALFILEERHFDQKSTLLFALPQRRRCDGVEGSIQERGML
jgi:hypothetical protein